jgi:hypothetical protein
LLRVPHARQPSGLDSMQSPLLGFNNNVKHRGRLFHIQTEDSGVRHPHVITHLFMDGGRILKTVKTSYVQHVGSDRLSEVVRDLMKEQHKMMFIALRDGQFDYVLDPDDAPPVSRAGGNSTSRATFQPTPTPPAGDGGPGLAKGATSQVGAKPSAAVKTARASQRREAPELFTPPPAETASVDAAPATNGQTAPPPTKKETRDRPSSGRYAASRPAAIFAAGRAPEAGGSIFGDDLISEKSLDEVILSYLSEDLDTTATKK